MDFDTKPRKILLKDIPMLLTNEEKATIWDKCSRTSDDDYGLIEATAEFVLEKLNKPVAWINQRGDYVELSTKSTVYGSHTIPLVKLQIE